MTATRPHTRRIAIAAGGTGGHLFPAEALSRALAGSGHRIALLTDPRTAQRASKLFESVHVIDGAGLVGRSTRERARASLALARGFVAARAALARLAPDVIVGFGGYPSVPPILASRTLLRRPRIVLHDQNAVLGQANRLLARAADACATSFERVDGVPRRLRRVVTGNPVRDAIAAIGPYAPPADTEALRILVLGGSLGARVFSDIVPQAAIALARTGRRLRIDQQARAEDVERVRAAYRDAGIEADISPFFGDVARLLERAHLVVARAGGSTVAELAACGRPALLVPLPIAASDEQTANAKRLVERGAAWMCPQPEFDAAWLQTHLAIAPDRLAQAAARARELSRPNAANDLARLVEDLASSRYDANSPIRDGRTFEDRDTMRHGTPHVSHLASRDIEA